MELVQFENGTFGVRTYWFFGWHFLSRHERYNFSAPEHIVAHCQMTKPEAMALMGPPPALPVKYEVLK